MICMTELLPKIVHCTNSKDKKHAGLLNRMYNHLSTGLPHADMPSTLQTGRCRNIQLPLVSESMSSNDLNSVF